MLVMLSASERPAVNFVVPAPENTSKRKLDRGVNPPLPRLKPPRDRRWHVTGATRNRLIEVGIEGQDIERNRSHAISYHFLHKVVG